MRGHDAIIALRRARRKPACVWLMDRDIEPYDFTVTLAPTDRLQALDLRFMVGLTVLLETDDPQRLEPLTQVCIAAKAGRVIANLHKRTGYHFEVVKTTDTEGLATWPK